ncbi:MAG: PIN domain-containing protein [Cyclobacteriaceae bacterium]|nr:PIN domain-containing protein [Cyclobacteriaceae bacterium SS2]
MRGRFFLDTNIFVYSFDHSQPKKRDTSIELINTALETGNGIISFQVVQEFINTSTRKFITPFSVEQIREYVKQFLKPIINVYPTEELYDEALSIMSKTNYSFYDSLIIAASLASDAAVLYTEDLQHGQKIGKLKIVNPFV